MSTKLSILEILWDVWSAVEQGDYRSAKELMNKIIDIIDANFSSS